MKAILIRNGRAEEAEELYIGEFDEPEVQHSDEVQVTVSAFGLNRMDIMQRKGKYPMPPYATTRQSKEILGVEFSGTVRKIGKDVSQWKTGDEVFGLVYGGAMAQYVVVKEGMIVRKPKELSFAQAASIPEQWMTAYQALNWIGKLEQGQSFLMHAGASGVGTAAIQLARQMGAEHVFASAGSDAKTLFLRNLGCTDAINYRTDDFVKVVENATQGKGVDLIVDPVGQSYIEGNFKALARDGRLVLLGFMSGSKREVDWGPVLYKRLRVQGTTLRSRSPEYQGKLLHELMGYAGDRFVSGRDKGGFDLVIHKTFKASEIVQATLEMEQAKNMGKIVCEVDW